MEECEFILIDVGATFHGYSSDITRTFLPKRTVLDECEVSGNYSLQELWTTVYEAQSAAIEEMRVGRNCSEVDLAARAVIEDAGLGKYFNHRLGHGLGIEGHERYFYPVSDQAYGRPYLNKGNTEIRLRAGNVFTAEPGMLPLCDELMIGVYIEGIAGVRLEDVVLVTEDAPELLSGQRAKDWFNP